MNEGHAPSEPGRTHVAIADCSEEGHRELRQEQRLQVLYLVLHQFTSLPAKFPVLAGFPGLWIPWTEAIATAPPTPHRLNLSPVGGCPAGSRHAESPPEALRGLGLTLHGQALPSKFPAIPLWGWSLPVLSPRPQESCPLALGPWRLQVSCWRSRGFPVDPPGSRSPHWGGSPDEGLAFLHPNRHVPRLPKSQTICPPLVSSSTLLHIPTCSLSTLHWVLLSPLS